MSVVAARPKSGSRILIVGAGIGGLSLARALEQHGLEFDIVEQSPTPSDTGAGIYLPGNAAAALAELGVMPRLAAQAHPISRQVILDSSGTVLHDMDVSQFWRGTGPCLGISRAALSRLLREVVVKSIAYGTKVIDLSDEADGMTATFSSGEKQRYDLVVGADGLQSTVRTLLFGVYPTMLAPRCWRLITENTPALKDWTVMLGRGRALLGVPIEGNKLYLYADDTTAAGTGSSPLRDLKALFSGFSSPLRCVITSLPETAQVHCARLAEVPARPWATQHSVLIGDASHASSPSMAQGAAMAIEDAVLLASLLARQAPGTAHFAFARQRLARTRWVQRQCHARDKTRAMPAKLRKLTLRFMGDRLYSRAYAPLRKTGSDKQE
uniref:FAD-dependent monooxygenase n=1 Tax=uncultured Sphingomonas sp. TaxID=158754 RepID=UPI0035CB9F6F